MTALDRVFDFIVTSKHADMPEQRPLSCVTEPWSLPSKVDDREFVPSRVERHGVLGVTNGGSPSGYRCPA